MKRLEQLNLHRRKALFKMPIIILFILVTLSAYGQTSVLKGTWVIEQVTIKKTVNGVVSEKTYSMKDRIESFVECPQKITFAADNKAIFEYHDRGTHEYRCEIEIYTVKIINPLSVREYGYTITEAGNIMLTNTIDYVYNHENGQVDKITEEYIYRGHKE